LLLVSKTELKVRGIVHDQMVDEIGKSIDEFLAR
jgi:hypothetical protein